MKIIRCLVLIFFVSTISLAENNPGGGTYILYKQKNRSVTPSRWKQFIGIRAYRIGLPLINIYAINQQMPALHNPFNYISEKEPYIEDKLWHFVGASMFTELNYYLFSELFSMEDPYLISALTSLTFWTGIECMDGLTGSGFSLLNETGDILGVTFAVLRLYYPNLPIRVRIGVTD